MKDKNGKTIKVGNFVRTPEGISQVGVLVSTTNSNSFHSSEVEVISAKDASASKGADGDSIIWGS